MNKKIYRATVCSAFLVASLFGTQLTHGQNATGHNRLPLETGDWYRDVFVADGARLITEPRHLGIANGKASVGVWHEYVGVIDGFWAPPLVASDFFVEPRIFGERIKTDHYTWLPYQVNQIGGVEGVRVTSSTTLLYGMRAGIVSLTFRNTTDETLDVPLQIVLNDPDTYRTTLDYRDKKNDWGFGVTRSKTPVVTSTDHKGIVRAQGDHGIAIGNTLSAMVWEEATRRFLGSVKLGAGEEKTVHHIFCMDVTDQAVANRDAILANPDAFLERAASTYAASVKDIFDKLPELHSQNKALERLYYRSLSILILNKFEIPEFALSPYYATGSIKGGCYKNYLWNYAAVSELLPLFDPEANKAHILQFLRSGGLYNGHSFDPVTGEGTGSWYPVNQNLIIKMVYDHIKNTGDTDFLKEDVDGKSLLDHLIRNALHLSNAKGGERLVDYGPRNDHLELRREFTYNHVMPDLNGLRYDNYHRVAELCMVVGRRAPDLLKRAETIKKLLKDELWDADKEWFAFRDPRGRKDFRYTIQMFYLLNSGVIDEDIERGLLRRLNEKEFLSPYGVHSLSKLDIGYDQVDIDNGGGGTCTLFPPQIAELLYRDGRSSMADDIMKRILWWGERLPYFGDSQVANAIDYRKDTPLQADIGTISVATSILFGMAGIQPGLDGTVSINPSSDLPGDYEIKNFRIFGATIGIRVEGDLFFVSTPDGTHSSRRGNPVVLKLR